MLCNTTSNSSILIITYFNIVYTTTTLIGLQVNIEWWLVKCRGDIRMNLILLLKEIELAYIIY